MLGVWGVGEELAQIGEEVIAMLPVLMRVKEVYETIHIHEANAKLRDGWVLIEVYHGSKGFTYVLGRVE